MIKKVLLNLIALIFKLIPRNKSLWVTGKTVGWEYSNNPPAFFDNSKYFFLYLVNKTNEKVYWISSSKEEIQLLKSMELPVVKYPSLKGIWLVLRANFSFHHYGPDQINYILQRGSIQIDFWHGTPLKMIRYDVTPKPETKDSLYRKMMCKGGAEYISSTSRYLSENILEKAFAVKKDKMINYGYPRMDVLKLDKDSTISFCKKYSQNLLIYIEMSQKHSKVFLYMPTFRDDDPDYFQRSNIDFKRLNEELHKIDGVFFLKLHPLTKKTDISKYDCIIQIDNSVDIYPFLTFTDYLITDYSSIFFDYLVLDKEIIFIPYDYDDYVSKRKLYFNYDDITPGVKYYSFSEFIDSLGYVDKLDYRLDRRRVTELLIEDYDFNACENTFNFIKGKYK